MQSNKHTRLQEENQRKNQTEPCYIERKQSLECLGENEASRIICEKEILNYRICKDFWVKIRTQRKRNNITPEIPPPEEQRKIKEEYFQRIRDIQNKRKAAE